MRKLLSIALVMCTFFSCARDDDFKFRQYPQKWQLVKTTGQVANAAPLTGAAMPWQEDYLLNSDGTFTKSRSQDGAVTEASGSYAFENLSDGNYLILTFNSENALIGNCTAEPKEVLAVQTNEVLHSTWNACDGPGLEYRRIE